MKDLNALIGMTKKATIHQHDETLFWISLPVPITGFDGFIGTWVHTADPVILIDVGPASASASLLAALSDLGVQRLDLILLTHIHIDHAGGIGTLARAFPHAPVVCHPKGLQHLADPERLWQGSLNTLGKIAEAYGPIQPVDAKQLLGADQLAIDALLPVETPGHAAHHYSYLLGDTVFAGEACGVNLPLDDAVYLRPATPPKFYLETSISSLDKLIALNPLHICYGHVGWRENAPALMEAHRNQLIRWKEMVQRFYTVSGDDPSATIHQCIDYLVASDSWLDGFARLDTDVQHRERGFLYNSVMGYWGYLKSIQ